MKGKVKFFNEKKGYGFITGEDEQDYFVHYTEIVGEGFKTLGEGEEVTFSTRPAERGPMAINVVREEEK